MIIPIFLIQISFDHFLLISHSACKELIEETNESSLSFSLTVVLPVNGKKRKKKEFLLMQTTSQQNGPQDICEPLIWTLIVPLVFFISLLGSFSLSLNTCLSMFHRWQIGHNFIVFGLFGVFFTENIVWHFMTVLGKCQNLFSGQTNQMTTWFYFVIFIESRIWQFMQTVSLICMNCQTLFSAENEKKILKCYPQVKWFTCFIPYDGYCFGLLLELSNLLQISAIKIHSGREEKMVKMIICEIKRICYR